jgi:Glycosyltransferase family 87
MTRQRLRVACLAALAASLLVHGWDLATPGLLDRSGRMKCPDFLQFYTYGALARTGQSASLYDGDAHARIARSEVDPRVALTGLRPNYSPIVAWLMAPLSALPYLRAMAVWGAASVALYFLAITLLLDLTRQLRADWNTVFLAAAAWPALFVVLRYGQLSAVSLVLVAAAARFASRGRPFAAGLGLGCLVYKPNLLIAPALIVALTGEWPLLAGLVAGAMLETLVAVVSVGPAVFEQYLRVLVTVAQRPELVQMFPTESHSVSGAVGLLLPWRSIAPLVSALALILAVWAAARVWKRTRDWRQRWAALVLASLLSSPHLLTYDLLLLAVPLLLVLDWRRESSGRWPEGAWLAAIVLMYAGAWPGTLLARLYGVQISTIGMGLGLALLFQQAQHELVGGKAEHDVVDGPTA